MNEIVTLAESLIPLICKLRHTTENDRRIAEPIVQALRESDINLRCRRISELTRSYPALAPYLPRRNTL